MLKGKKANEGPRNVCSDFAVAAYAIPYARSAACSIWIILSNKNIHGPPRHSTSTPGPLVCHTHLPWASQQSLSARSHTTMYGSVPWYLSGDDANARDRTRERKRKEKEEAREKKKKEREMDREMDREREGGEDEDEGTHNKTISSVNGKKV